MRRRSCQLRDELDRDEPNCRAASVSASAIDDRPGNRTDGRLLDGSGVVPETSSVERRGVSAGTRHPTVGGRTLPPRRRATPLVVGGNVVVSRHARSPVRHHARHDAGFGRLRRRFGPGTHLEECNGQRQARTQDDLPGGGVDRQPVHAYGLSIARADRGRARRRSGSRPATTRHVEPRPAVFDTAATGRRSALSRKRRRRARTVGGPRASCGRGRLAALYPSRTTGPVVDDTRAAADAR